MALALVHWSASFQLPLLFCVLLFCYSPCSSSSCCSSLVSWQSPSLTAHIESPVAMLRDNRSLNPLLPDLFILLLPISVPAAEWPSTENELLSQPLSTSEEEEEFSPNSWLSTTTFSHNQLNLLRL